MASLETSSLSSSIKTLYEKQLLTRALPRLVHGRFGKLASWKGYGSYELRRWESLDLVSSALTGGNTPTEDRAPTITVVTMTPAWYGSWVGFTDKVDLTSYDPVIGEIAELQGEQAGLSIDTLVRNSLTDGATKDYSGDASARTGIDTSNDVIAFTDFIQNVAELEAQNARPLEGMFYVVVIHPHTLATLMQDSTFITLFTREGGEALRSGFIGTILNCKIYVSSNAREYVDGGAASADVYSMLFIGAEAYGVAGLTGLTFNYNADAGAPQTRGGMTGQKVKPVEVIVRGLGETGFDPLKQRGTSGWKVTHTLNVLQALWMRDLEHATDFS